VEDSILNEPVEIITLGSDGSVNLREERAACAWMVQQTENNCLKACYILENTTSLTSYRSELEGMYRGLKQVEALPTLPTQLNQWCDNKAAVDQCNEVWVKPGSLIKPDADVLLAIQHVCSTLGKETSITCQHVYRHQDTRSPRISDKANEYDSTPTCSCDEYDNDDEQQKTPQPTQQSMSLQARINIECDRIATETMAASRGQVEPLGQIIRLPYEGSKALLCIDGRWITSQQRQYICDSKWGLNLREYCCRRYTWSDQVFDSIRWKMIQSVRRRMTRQQQRQTSKIMHGWLPVMHQQGFITGMTTQCPACRHPDETMEHLFKCNNAALMVKKDALIVEFRTKGIAAGIPRAIMEAICSLLYAFIHETEVTIPEHPGIAAAVKAQLSVGLRLLPRGYLVTDWLDVIEEFGVQNPESRLSGLLKRLWLEFTDQIWRNRNEVMHSADSNTRQQEDDLKAEKLKWYLRNIHIIAPWDRFVLEYTEESVELMSSYVKSRLVRNLETLQKVYAEERLTAEKGQSIIRKYFRTKETEL
jgi:hypothetical protein